MKTKTRFGEQLFYNTAQAAEVLGLGRHAIYRAIRTGDLKVFRPKLPRVVNGKTVIREGQYLIRPEDLKAFARKMAA